MQIGQPKQKFQGIWSHFSVCFRNCDNSGFNNEHNEYYLDQKSSIKEPLNLIQIRGIYYTFEWTNLPTTLLQLVSLKIT